MKKAIKIYAVAHSANAKTGDIPQTYTSANTCPVRCPLKNSGCYAENYGACFTWARAEKAGMDPTNLAEWVKNNTDSGALIRHNVAGDIAKQGTSKIDADLLYTLIDAYKDRNAYTYSHCALTKHNLSLMYDACVSGFTVNASCERLADCDKAISAGVPAVIALTEYEKGMRTPAGRRVVLCPAQSHDDISCKKCRICYRHNRSSIIAFLVHGSRASKAAAAIRAINDK